MLCKINYVTNESYSAKNFNKKFQTNTFVKQLLYNNLEQEVPESWYAESSILYIKFYRFLASR